MFKDKDLRKAVKELCEILGLGYLEPAPQFQKKIAIGEIAYNDNDKLPITQKQFTEEVARLKKTIDFISKVQNQILTELHLTIELQEGLVLKKKNGKIS